MSDTIERVARTLTRQTIDEQTKHNFPYSLEDKQRLVDRYWDQYVDNARGILEAMREPTEAMLGEGAAKGSSPKMLIRDAWEAMIDEALK